MLLKSLFKFNQIPTTYKYKYMTMYSLSTGSTGKEDTSWCLIRIFEFNVSIVIAIFFSF